MVIIINILSYLDLIDFGKCNITSYIMKSESINSLHFTKNGRRQNTQSKISTDSWLCTCLMLRCSTYKEMSSNTMGI